MKLKELPKLSDRALADLDGNGVIDPTEWDAWLQQLQLGENATLILNLVHSNAAQMKDQAPAVIAAVDSVITQITDEEISVLEAAISHLGFDASSLHVEDSLWRSVRAQQRKSDQIWPTFPMQ